MFFIYANYSQLKAHNSFKNYRHDSYPTTDLNVVIDFSTEDKATLKRILDARLSPLIERVYGISRDSIRANDIFFVRYDGEGQQALNKHTDGSHISFNVLLNDEFEGGGTRFHNRLDSSYEDARPKPGQVLINNAMVHHEGLPTTKGTRYILVGFMNVDVKDPWTSVRKSVSWFSTYLSFPWLTVCLKEALMVSQQTGEGATRNGPPIFSKNFYINSLLTHSVVNFSKIGDASAPHGIVSLVNEENSEAYIDALESFHDHNGKQIDNARWYSGQQIFLNLNGTFRAFWQLRTNNPDKFKDDL